MEVKVDLGGPSSEKSSLTDDLDETRLNVGEGAVEESESDAVEAAGVEDDLSLLKLSDARLNLRF